MRVIISEICRCTTGRQGQLGCNLVQQLNFVVEGLFGSWVRQSKRVTIPGNDAFVVYQHAAPQNGRGLNDAAVGGSVAEALCSHVHAKHVKMLHKRLT